jgi:hypothetical protein
MTTLDPDLARRLAQSLLPNLRFADREQYYPIRAESWLTHTTSAPWPPGPGEAAHDDVAGLAVDAHHRGTAVVSADALVTDVRHLAGPPNLADEPLQITGKDDPASIGWSGYRDPKREVFLSFAGWDKDDHREQGGDLGYLYDAFSELASALDHRLAWRPLSGRDNRPSFAHDQPPSPAVYCEIDWAGVHPRTALRHGHQDFGTQLLHDLDNYVQVTYYYLYAARAPLADPPQADLPPMEGQWAAVSFFLPAKVGEQLDEHGRPVMIDVVDTNPKWVVFSYDYRNGHPLAQAYAADDPALETFLDPATGRFCVSAYVGAGSHRFFAAPNGETPLSGSDPWPTLDYYPGTDYDGLLTGLFVALLPAELVGGLFGWIFGNGTVGDIVTGIALLAGIILLAIFAWPVLAALLAFAFLWAVFELLSMAWDDDSPPSPPPSGDPPSAPGASAGDRSHGNPAPPGSGQGPPGGGFTGPPDGPGGGYLNEPTGWWPTNEGSPSGADVGFFDVMVISRLASLSSADPTLLPPAWWDFPGGWGIKIPSRVDAAWESGMPRVDGDERSWAYWNALALVDHLMQLAPSPPGS